jgi:acetate kinase
VRILAVNAGSSSLKLRLLDDSDRTLAEREVEGTGGRIDRPALAEAVGAAGEVDAVGHRVVHGGDRYSGPVLLDDSTLEYLDSLTELAPLHQPPSLEAIREVRRLLPSVPAVACFDTAFHATMPAAASTYAIPASWSERWPLRRYGFHGLSHSYASRRAAELLDRPLAELRIVTAHLGAGASLCAVAGGRSVDTTMGFTPIEGLVMATRSGSVDPGLLLWVQRHGGIGAGEMEQALDRESGLLALSGRSGDMREIVAGVEEGDERCRLAFDAYIHRLCGGIAAMAAAMGGIDALVFTGGVGEHVGRVRADACERLAFLGLEVSRAASSYTEGGAILSPPSTATAVIVLAAREDTEIARGVRSALGGLKMYM